MTDALPIDALDHPDHPAPQADAPAGGEGASSPSIVPDHAPDHAGGAGGSGAGGAAGGDVERRGGRRRRRRRRGGGSGGGTPGGAGGGAEGTARGEPGEPWPRVTPEEDRDDAEERLGRRREGAAGEGPGEAVEGLDAEAAADIFHEASTFEQMPLRSSVLRGLHAMDFRRPTRIQAELIPAVLSGRDVLGQAKTGTGKTAAFAIPLLQRVDRDGPMQALVLCPTRELAMQITREINELGRYTRLRAVAVIGGERISQQAEQLRRGAQIVVSTPGRLLDMHERGLIRLDAVRFAVLDEVDRMLDIGFRDDIRRILGMCPPPGQRQTIFVSATIPPEVEKLARSQSRDPQKIVAVTAGALTTSLVRQFYLPVNPWDRRRLLLHMLTHEEPALTVVFCRTKRGVDEVCEFLKRHGIDAHAIHGDMYQSKRNKVIERLHAGDLSVLVASDLASRGLDVDGITHVINYDMPEDPEVYVHRIGRTARIGREGVAWSFVMPDQGELLTNVEMLINMEIPKLEYPDFKPSEPPQGRRDPGAPAPAPRPVNRYVASIAPPIPAPQAVDPGRFPGGIVPSRLPPKRMFGKVKTSASLKDLSLHTTLPPTPTPPHGGTAPEAGRAG
jgi:ATP-dependent RNA helicase DeaD